MSIYSDKRIQDLARMVEEAERSTKEGVKYFIEPRDGALSRARNKRHQIIFGRRGSGKSSLLRKVENDLSVERRPVAYVNLESFKQQSYPDVLLSVLIKTFQEFRSWLDTIAVSPSTKRSVWNIFSKAPTVPSLNRSKCKALSAKLSRQIDALKNELYSAETRNTTYTFGEEHRKDIHEGFDGSLHAGPAKLGTSIEGNEENKKSSQLQQHYMERKEDFLQRRILELQEVFSELAQTSGGDAFLLLDDLYHIRRQTQPSLLDYFHKIAKDHRLWLKIGTVKNRTQNYENSDPPRGMKVGDDVQDIDLDLTLENYKIAKEFLARILDNFAQKAGFKDSREFLAEGAMNRLVLASGGVARDFLSIFRRSIDYARDRGPGHHRGERISVEDVNTAAGNYDTLKRQEFHNEASPDAKDILQDELSRIRNFCLQHKANCVLVDKDVRGARVEALRQLVDLKFLHLVQSRITVKDRPGALFEAYMLDLSQHTGTRRQKGLPMLEFWKSPEVLRKTSLILPMDENASIVSQTKNE